jgi:putative acetyltransferase
MIREYRSDDCDAVLEVWAAASAVAHPFLTAAFLATERHNIANLYLLVAETWVWEASGRVAGFIALVGNEVGGLFVHPALHRRGIGRALMDHARGLYGELEVEVFKDNALGRAFYKEYGFVELREAVHEDTGFTVMRLRLPPAQATAEPGSQRC